jgi:hypothetical protein
MPGDVIPSSLVIRMVGFDFGPVFFFAMITKVRSRISGGKSESERELS